MEPAEVVASVPFAAARVSGSDGQAPNPSKTYSVTVQHVNTSSFSIITNAERMLHCNNVQRVVL